LCGQSADFWHIPDGRTGLSFDCPGCGRFIVSLLLATGLNGDWWRDLRPRVSWRVREATDAGEVLELTRENFESLAVIQTFRSPGSYDDCWN
jgi:hypothetical protein